MTDADGQQISLDANVLEADSEPFLQVASSTEEAVCDETTSTSLTVTNTEGGDIVSKAFTTVDEGTEPSMEYGTIAHEETATVEPVTIAEEETMTTSLQFDPANPSVLYTADGTPVNQADLTPEEQALVQAALQQHLAEQEAEQQLQMIQEVDATLRDQTGPGRGESSEQNIQEASAIGPREIAESTSEDSVIAMDDESSNLTSSDTSASQIVRTLANNVRKQQERMETPCQDAKGETHTPEAKYSEKIVIRQGQPELVKVPATQQPDIPVALADLMPKVEIGKDGSQVIRIHQSQITPGQLRALQENPNVRLVFRSASTTKQKGAVSLSAQKKRGRPRRVHEEMIEKEAEVLESEEPPAKTRSGRVTKRSVFMKDYFVPKLSSKEVDEDYDPMERRTYFTPISASPFDYIKPRGRPPGRPRGSYANKIGSRQNTGVADPLPKQMMPALTPIEMAMSARRKNRLREMLSACSEDEIMEVTMPHLARAFSLWEFLVTKVEKNKMSRAFFADVYREYECLHQYLARLAEKYKQAILEKAASEVSETSPKGAETGNGKGADHVTKDKDLVEVTFAKLAESLGLKGSTMREAEVNLLDSEELKAITRNLAGMNQMHKRSEDKNQRQQVTTAVPGADGKSNNSSDGAKATEASPAQITSPQKPLGQAQEMAAPEESNKQQDTTITDASMEADDASAATDATASGSQLIQIGQGEDRQFIEVPEGYTLIQTPEGLVMSQPGTTVSQGEDGALYITHEDGTTTPLSAAAQQGVPMETVETLLSLDGQQH